MKLSLKQTKALDYLEDNTTKEVLFGGGAGGGKSALGVYWLAKSCLKYPGSRHMMGRASTKTLKETTLNSFFEICRLQGLKSGTHYRYIDNPKSSVVFANGSEILLKDLYSYPSDPNFDELGSLEITSAFIDEANQVTEKAKNIVKSRIRFRIDEFGIIPKLLMTCNPAKNWVYSEFYKPSRDNTLPEEKRFIQSLLDDNPFISKHYKESLLTLDNNSKQRLLYGNWEYDDDPAALMNYDSILNLFTNTFVSKDKDPSRKRYISADIARLGRDQTVIGIWDGLRCIKIVILPKNKVTEAAAMIKRLAHEYNVPLSNIIVDEDGVGGGVVDILGCKGFVNNSSPVENPENGVKENFSNLKSQCYFALARVANNNEMYIENIAVEAKSMLIEELEQVKQKDMDKDGKRAIVGKDKVKEIIGRSPDFSDMLAMRMYFELQPTWDQIFF